MLWHLTSDRIVTNENADHEGHGKWGLPQNDGFGLPFIAALFGYQSDQECGMEHLLPESSHPTRTSKAVSHP